MENTMRTIGQYITDNFAGFGLSAANELQLIAKSKDPLLDGSRRLILLQVSNLPGWSRRPTAFGNLTATNQRTERWESQISLECKTRAAQPDQDFYWNEARKFRDQVLAALAGDNRGGITIPRINWDDAGTPQDGEIHFEVEPTRPSPIEDTIEDPEDPANKSIFLTFTIPWWKEII